MRTLHFQPASKQYDLAYQCLLYSPRTVATHERKAHGRLLDKLERIGTPVTVPAPGGGDGETIATYALPDGGTVYLEESELELLRVNLDAILSAPSFRKALLRDGVALLDELAVLPEEIAGDAPVSA